MSEFRFVGADDVDLLPVKRGRKPSPFSIELGAALKNMGPNDRIAIDVIGDEKPASVKAAIFRAAKYVGLTVNVWVIRTGFGVEVVSND